MERVTFQIYISGRVQGVGYRRFAQKQAQKYDLFGWARNLLDGRVEIKVAGLPSQIDAYLEVLRQGPAFSQVREVIAHQVTVSEIFKEFSIHPDQEIQ